MDFTDQELALITRTLRTRTFDLHDSIRSRKEVRDDMSASHHLRGHAALVMQQQKEEIESLEGIIETLVAARSI